MTAVRLLAMRARADFADTLAGLNAGQWLAPSLCDGWCVRDVVAHTVAYLGQTTTQLAVNMVRAWGRVDRLNTRGLAAMTSADPPALVAMMRRGIEPTGAGALYGGRVALIECLVHHQDVRRPLGLHWSIPEDHLRVSLNYARVSPVIAGGRRTRGIRLVATDIDWSAGRGPQVRGTAESLLLAMTGRAAHVQADLYGDGVTLLAARQGSA